MSTAQGELDVFNTQYGTNLTPDQLEKATAPIGLNEADADAWNKRRENILGLFAKAADDSEQANDKLSTMSADQVTAAQKMMDNAQNSYVKVQAAIKLQDDTASIVAAAQKSRLNRAQTEVGGGDQGPFKGNEPAVSSGDTQAAFDQMIDTAKVQSQAQAMVDAFQNALSNTTVKPPKMTVDLGNTQWEFAGLAALPLLFNSKILGALGGLAGMLGEGLATIIAGTGGTTSLVAAVGGAISSVLEILGTVIGAITSGAFATISAALLATFVSALGELSFAQEIIKAIQVKDWATVIRDAAIAFDPFKFLPDLFMRGISDIFEKFSWTKPVGEWIDNLRSAIEKSDFSGIIKAFEDHLPDVVKKAFGIGNASNAPVGGGSIGNGPPSTGSPQPFIGNGPPHGQLGAWNIPSNDFLMSLEQGEMVVPPSIAETIRKALSSPTPQIWSAPPQAPSVARSGQAPSNNQNVNSGGNYNQNAPLIHVDSLSVRSQTDINDLARKVSQILAQEQTQRRRSTGFPNGLGNGVSPQA
jgi:hypothetical protein